MSSRFWERVRPDGLYGCWSWRGGINGAGYGVYDHGMAHREAWRLTFGAIPAGLQVDHLCRVRWCVNPAHMELVTPAENKRRGEAHKTPRGRGGKCHRGHPLSGENLYLVEDKYGTHRKCRACRAMQRQKSLRERR